MDGAFVPGDRLGPLKLGETLGSGGMGRVYAATVEEAVVPDLPVGTRVAAKVVHPHLLVDETSLTRFQREVEYGRAVVSDHVVRTHAGLAVTDDRGRKSHVMVMELVEGRTLRSLSQELERVPEELCRQVAVAVADGLRAIHEAGVIHRDIKPENVLITPDHTVKIMDLGVARFAEETVRLSRTGMFVGSILYAAPESFRASETEPDARADLYALGLLLYELAAGRHPFVGKDVADTVSRILTLPVVPLGVANPQVSPFLEQLVSTLISREVGMRPESAAAVGRILAEGETGEWWVQRASEVRTETRRALRRPRIPRETAVHGRETELSKLRRLFRSASERAGRVVLLEGEAGIGKSRLVDELVERLGVNRVEHDFVFTSYAPGASPDERAGIGPALLSHLGREGLRELIGPRSALGAAFVAAVAGEESSSDLPPLSLDSLASCHVRAVRALAERRPLILFVDDLHFASSEEQAYFSAITRAVADHPVLVIGSLRPGRAEEWSASLARLDHVEHHALDRLGPKDLARLLVEFFRSEDLAEDLSFRIAVKSDGNPFFVFEILRGLQEARLISKSDDGSWASTRRIDHIDIPSSVQELITARLADVPEEGRQLLDLAACAGFEFDPTLLAEATGESRLAVLRLLGLMERRHRIVRSLGRRFVFDHHQVQESLIEALPELLREEYHSLLADALIGREAASDHALDSVTGQDALVLCRHLLHAGRGDEADRVLDAALETLKRSHAHLEVVALLERTLSTASALSDVRQSHLHGVLSRRLEDVGRLRDAKGHAQTAVTLAEPTGDRMAIARAHSVLGWARLRLSEPVEAAESFSKALELAEDLGHLRFEAEVTSGLAGAISNTGDNVRAKELVLHQLDLARAIGRPEDEAAAMTKLGLVSRMLGERETAIEWCERSVRLSRKIGDHNQEMRALGGRYVTLYMFGRHLEALPDVQRQLDLAKELGDRGTEALATGNLGAGLLVLGRYEEAARYLERHIQLCRENGTPEGEARSLGNLGALRLLSGDSAGAYELMRRHLELATSIGAGQERIHALLNTGAIEASWGVFDTAEERLEEALARSRSRSYRYGEGYALQALGTLAVERDDDETAEQRFREALDVRRAMSQVDGIAETLAALGSLIARQERTAEAASVLEEAIEVAKRAGNDAAALLAICRRAELPGGNVELARQRLALAEGRVSAEARFRGHRALFRATDDPRQRELAEQLRAHLLGHSPEEHRDHVSRRLAI